jgi:hypothetical protein
MVNFSRATLVNAICLAQNQVSWKPGKADAHLAKRIRLGHLPQNATVTDYELLIAALLNTPDAKVYVYEFGEIIYPTLVSPVDQTVWLAMITINGVMETAFPPAMPDQYLSQPSFTYIGLLGELS